MALEKGASCGETWRAQRWDSFRLVTEDSLCGLLVGARWPAMRRSMVSQVLCWPSCRIKPFRGLCSLSASAAEGR